MYLGYGGYLSRRMEEKEERSKNGPEKPKK